MKNFVAIKEISNKLAKDGITGYAAQSCFYIVLSFFPFIMLLLSLIRFLPINYTTFINALEALTPAQIHPMLDVLITDLFERSTLTLTSASAIATLWAAGKGFMSLMKGFNTIYEIDETRNWIAQRIIASIYTLIFLILIIFSLLLMVFGNRLLDVTSGYLPTVSNTIYSILEMKYIIFPCILMLVFMGMYKIIPSRKVPMIRELPGALLASLGWFLFSYFYSLYIDHSPNFSYMYGSLTTLIFALIWLYFCMIILFFGAEFNTFIEKQIISYKMFKRTNNPKLK